MSSTTEVATIPAAGSTAVGAEIQALVPLNFEGFWRIAQMLTKGGIVPKMYEGKPEMVMSAMMLGAELGLNPFTAVQNIAVINGKPSIYGDIMLALVRASGKLQTFEERMEGEGGQMKAICTTLRVGDVMPHTTEFSVADAQTAGLWKKAGPWTTYPTRMMMFRARGWNLRDQFGDVLMGVYSREEAEDIEMTAGADGVYVSRGNLNATLEEVNAGRPAQEKPPEVPWFDPSSWKKLKDHGMNEFVSRNLQRMGEVPAEILEEMKAKWVKVISYKPWPVTPEQDSAPAGAESADSSLNTSSLPTTGPALEQQLEPLSTGQPEATVKADEHGVVADEEFPPTNYEKLVAEVNLISNYGDITRWGQKHGNRITAMLPDTNERDRFWEAEYSRRITEIKAAM